eukprot:363756-Chlamydomonas_euryale.AAC.4
MALPSRLGRIHKRARGCCPWNVDGRACVVTWRLLVWNGHPSRGAHAYYSCIFLVHTAHADHSRTPLTHTTNAYPSCTPLMHTTHADHSYTPLMRTTHAPHHPASRHHAHVARMRRVSRAIPRPPRLNPTPTRVLHTVPLPGLCHQPGGTPPAVSAVCLTCGRRARCGPGGLSGW